ncbi:unnamed protein product [Owenia fusiformis]|uniref:Uncharacterized protein n=1 Tax=Owenia fusiformis TaxID=6347 RepID=A0A8J1UK81_OWEFU|nr:unnamed protein product [Owenia fusiformis]
MYIAVICTILLVSSNLVSGKRLGNKPTKKLFQEKVLDSLSEIKNELSERKVICDQSEILEIAKRRMKRVDDFVFDGFFNQSEAFVDEMYDENAILFNPGQEPIIGIQAIKDTFRTSFKPSNNLVTEVKEAFPLSDCNGFVSMARHVWTLTDGTLLIRRSANTWKKLEDGHWVMIRDFPHQEQEIPPPDIAPP